jgi:antirestriction protein
MYERSYGSKYKELGGYQPASHIARLMRVDIKAAIERGELPGAMKNYSVRVHNYSGGRAIYIEARDLEDMWQDCDGTKPGSKHYFTASDGTQGWTAMNCGYHGHGRPDFEGHQVLTIEGCRVQEILKGIHRAYNYDGSEVMVDYFDVNYYGDASIEDQWHRDIRRIREAERKAAKEAKAS